MTVTIYKFNTGGEGTAITSGNATPTVTPATVPQVTLNGGSATFAAAMAFEGSYGAKFTNVAAQLAIIRCYSVATSNTMAFVFGYTTQSTTPAETQTFANIRAAASVAVQLRHTTANEIRIYDSPGTAFLSLLTGATASTKYRIEIRVIVATATTGTVQANIYTATGTTALNGTLVSSTTFNCGTATLASVDIGRVAGVTIASTMGMDYVGLNDGSTTEIGPPSTNVPPTCTAGSPQYVAAGATISLTGATETDTDGTIASQAWTVTEYPGVSAPGITNATSLTAATVTLADPGNYTLTLTVTDNQGATGTATVKEYVYPPSGTDTKVYSVTGPFTNEGGAVSAKAALNDGTTVTNLQSLTNPTSAIYHMTMDPCGPGPITFYATEDALTATTATRVANVYKADGTTLIYTLASLSIIGSFTERAITIDSTGLAAIPALSDRYALVVDLIYTAT